MLLEKMLKRPLFLAVVATLLSQRAVLRSRSRSRRLQAMSALPALMDLPALSASEARPAQPARPA
jgi:hypothetical protein